METTSWGRGITLSLILHGLVLAAGTALIPGPGTPDRGLGPGPFEVRLLSPGPDSRADVPTEARTPRPSPTRPEAAAPRPPAVEPAARPDPAQTLEMPESTSEAGSPDVGGAGTSAGTGPEGTMSGGSDGEGEARYQPPRLLAGALPIAPRDVEPLDVPPEIPVRILVGTDGRVKEIEPLLPGLPPPVLEAIRGSADAMRFAPARRGAAPVEAWFTMTFVHRR